MVKGVKYKPLSEARKKKISLAMKGRVLTEEHKRKISESKKGRSPWINGRKHHTEETKKKISETNRGKDWSILGGLLKGHTPWNKGKSGVVSEEALKKMSEAHKGEKSHLWKGGISAKPYGLNFSRRLREKIRKRDNYRCQECFRHQGELFKNTRAGVRPYKLHIHHIDYDKENSNEENLISLCSSCHMQTNFKREDWIEYFAQKKEGFNQVVA